MLRVHEPGRPPAVTVREGGGDRTLPARSSFAELEQVGEGWFYDTENAYLWVRLPAPVAEIVLSYEAGQ